MHESKRKAKESRKPYFTKSKSLLTKQAAQKNRRPGTQPTLIEYMCDSNISPLTEGGASDGFDLFRFFFEQ